MSKEMDDKMIQRGVYNTIYVAPTRRGKGVSRLVPALLTYPASMIALADEDEHFEKNDLRDANIIANILTQGA
jgi:type IV secretory pathway TraG/TraD family ATPase VirD4